MPDQSSPPAETVLAQLGWLPEGRQPVSATAIGAGNMNLVERITLDDGSTRILKRAHGWVQKYPHIPAPIERAAVEAAFYGAIAGTPAGAMMPAHLGFDQGRAANLLADLGDGVDGMVAYAGEVIAGDTLDAVAAWTRCLHDLPVPPDASLANNAMRALNALHIFDFPLDPANGFDLDAITPGLQAMADRLKHDGDFIAAVQAERERYLGDGPGVLLHGDLYPGSWLTTAAGEVFLIDPEFCWIGPREWDVGVLMAHLQLSGQAEASTDRLLSHYGHPLDRALDHALLRRIAGIEIMRRLIGVAQLPLGLDLAAKARLLDSARNQVLGAAE